MNVIVGVLISFWVTSGSNIDWKTYKVRQMLPQKSYMKLGMYLKTMI